MRLKHNLDLELAALFSLLLIPAVLLTDSVAARVALGVPFLLFIPGYAMLAAFFPGRARLAAVERLAYSVALSIAIVILDALLLNYVWEIDTFPLLITLESLTLPVIIIAWLRRRSLPQDEGRGPNEVEQKTKMPAADKILTGLLAVALIGAGVSAVYAGIRNAQPYSEIYLLGAGGKAADYPQNLSVGQEGQLTLVLINHEKETVSYTIKIVQEGGLTLINGAERNEISVTLANGQQQNYAVAFSFDAPGTGKKLEFDLHKGDSTEVYLKTYLRVDVS